MLRAINMVWKRQDLLIQLHWLQPNWSGGPATPRPGPPHWASQLGGLKGEAERGINQNVLHYIMSNPFLDIFIRLWPETIILIFHSQLAQLTM